MKYINGPYNGEVVRPFFYMRIEETRATAECGIYERDSMRVDFTWMPLASRALVKDYITKNQENLYING